MKKGDQIAFVRNTQLASALLTIGIPLRADYPYSKVEQGGTTNITWHFELSDLDGEFNTLELMKAWADSDAWLKKNGQHPFAYAMMTIKNYRELVDHTHRAKPFVIYKITGTKKQMMCIKGSNREQECINQGWQKL